MREPRIVRDRGRLKRIREYAGRRVNPLAPLRTPFQKVVWAAWCEANWLVVRPA